MSLQKTITRRHFLTTSGALAAGSMATPGARARGAPDAAPPNVVFILSDDQGWGDYSFMGHPHIRTPHIDRLATESVVFTRGYVAAPLCCPSLASIITGLHPHQNRRTCNDPPRTNGRKWTPERLALRRRMIEHVANARTLPRLLAPLGYLSMQTGKWWEGHYRTGGFTHGMTHGDPARGGRHGDVGLKIGRDTMQPIHDFVDTARAESKPFFLWYAPMMPHSPHNPPKRLFDAYAAKAPTPHIARYWAMCEWFDETCGQLLDHLDANGLRDNTIVCYICDNGWIQHPDSPRPAGRSKMTSYEGGVRTPIMVRWPGHAEPRRNDTSPVSAVDLVPTVLAACGLEPREPLQGLNLLDRPAIEARNGVFGAGYGHDAVDVNDPVANLRVRWTVSGKWKLLLPFRRNVPGDAVQLYDVVADPAETTDLAPDNPEVVKRLIDRIQAWWPLNDTLPPKFTAPPPEAIAFDMRRDPAGWRPARDIRHVQMTAEGLRVTAAGNDPILVISPCNIDPAPIQRVRVRLSAGAGTMVEFRWGTESFERIDPNKVVQTPLRPGGEMQEVVLEVGQHPLWQGDRIKRLRLDPGDAKGTFVIESIIGE